MKIPARLQASPSRPVPLIVGAVVLALLAVLCVVVAVGRSADAAQVRNETHARTELAQVAGGIVADVFSVSTDDWRSEREQARAIVTDSFAATFAAQFDRPPEDGIAAVRWQPRYVGVIDVTGGDYARGDVVIDARTVTVLRNGQEQTQVRSVRATFERDDDSWLLARVVVLR